MADYVDKDVQTIIAGLTKHPSPNPSVLFDATSTPPEDMPTKELQLPSEATPAISKTNADNPNVSPTLLLRRKKRPPLVARISLPPSEAGVDAPRSPPPTESAMSPLPAANRLYAGHTPIFPRSLSPLQMQDDSSGSSTPEQDEALGGPLTLPAQPGDGAEDRIELKVLDAELERIAKGQGAVDEPEVGSNVSPTAENGGQSSRNGLPEACGRSSAEDTEVVDGVILKKPRMNLGAPLGQV